MRCIDLRHCGLEKVIGCWDIDGVLVDPGPESCFETLLAALDAPPRAVLLTHIHFDHAGATGALLERFPDVPVYVHERGARHLVNPERLVASATQIYGEEGMRRLWGRVVPVPEDALTVLGGGETVLGDYEVIYTPGHASHHVCYRHRPSGRALVGDMGGVRIPPSKTVIAPTPPPDIDLDAWHDSLDRIAAWEPSALCLTHFGLVEEVEWQIATVRDRLEREAALQEANDLEGFIAVMRGLVADDPSADADAYLQASPPDHLYQGLKRWREKFVAVGDGRGQAH